MRDQLVDMLQSQAVQEVRRVLIHERTVLHRKAWRRVFVAYLIIGSCMLIYYGGALMWSTLNFVVARDEFMVVCETYTTTEVCRREFAALNLLDNSFAIGASPWWLMKLLWPVGVFILLCLVFRRVVSLTSVAWAVWRLSQAE